MSQSIRFLINYFTDVQIPLIIEEAINQKYKLSVIDKGNSQERLLKPGELADILSKGSKGKVEITLEQPHSQEVGHFNQTVSFGRRQFISYSDLRAEQNVFDQIKLDLGINQNISDQIKNNSTISDRNVFAPSFLDKNHPNFAPELKIAHDAWTDIYSDPEKHHNRGVKTELQEWMNKKNIKVSSDAQLDRIATVITRQKRKDIGGALPSQATDE